MVYEGKKAIVFSEIFPCFNSLTFVTKKQIAGGQFVNLCDGGKNFLYTRIYKQ